MVYMSCMYSTYVYVQIWNPRPVPMLMCFVCIYVQRYIQIRTIWAMVSVSCMYNKHKYVQYWIYSDLYIFICILHVYTYTDTYEYVLYVLWCTYIVRIVRTYTYTTEYVQYVQNNTYKYTYKYMYKYTYTKIRTIIRIEYVRLLNQKGNTCI